MIKAQYPTHVTIACSSNPSILHIALVTYTVLLYTKKLWQIRTVVSLAEKKLWQIEVHLYGECYGNCENWQKNLAKCCNLPNLPKFFPCRCFLLYGMLLLQSSYCMGSYTLAGIKSLWNSLKSGTFLFKCIGFPYIALHSQQVLLHV